MDTNNCTIASLLSTNRKLSIVINTVYSVAGTKLAYAYTGQIDTSIVHYST
jgi:hypothetical protein